MASVLLTKEENGRFHLLAMGLEWQASDPPFVKWGKGGFPF